MTFNPCTVTSHPGTVTSDPLARLPLTLGGAWLLVLVVGAVAAGGGPAVARVAVGRRGGGGVVVVAALLLVVVVAAAAAAAAVGQRGGVGIVQVDVGGLGRLAVGVVVVVVVAVVVVVVRVVVVVVGVRHGVGAAQAARRLLLHVGVVRRRLHLQGPLRGVGLVLLRAAVAAVHHVVAEQAAVALQKVDGGEPGGQNASANASR